MVTLGNVCAGSLSLLLCAFENTSTLWAYILRIFKENAVTKLGHTNTQNALEQNTTVQSENSQLLFMN